MCLELFSWAFPSVCLLSFALFMHVGVSVHFFVFLFFLPFFLAWRAPPQLEQENEQRMHAERQRIREEVMKEYGESSHPREVVRAACPSPLSLSFPLFADGGSHFFLLVFSSSSSSAAAAAALVGR